MKLDYKKMGRENRKLLMQLHQEDKTWNSQNVFFLITLLLSGLAVLISTYTYVSTHVENVRFIKIVEIICFVILFILIYAVIRYGSHFYFNARKDHDKRREVIVFHFKKYQKRDKNE